MHECCRPNQAPMRNGPTLSEVFPHSSPSDLHQGWPFQQLASNSFANRTWKNLCLQWDMPLLFMTSALHAWPVRRSAQASFTFALLFFAYQSKAGLHLFYSGSKTAPS